ncbi:hypothetical protein THAOC_28250 [Thalassiosira oceanica]|uniref:Uncharacterized protein n=1 Tax=Thalassiosira oceanica TaxID=159749 RepID=K0S0P4_THAOC|nr:hypothetical protein THAOC_28250 [Thalassiosira oceanica]|eukprot:EJK52467.1 hypothetical protein THAOC_28250 [Thalassiosira oceanica]
MSAFLISMWDLGAGDGTPSIIDAGAGSSRLSLRSDEPGGQQRSPAAGRPYNSGDSGDRSWTPPDRASSCAVEIMAATAGLQQQPGATSTPERRPSTTTSPSSSAGSGPEAQIWFEDDDAQVNKKMNVCPIFR